MMEKLKIAYLESKTHSHGIGLTKNDKQIIFQAFEMFERFKRGLHHNENKKPYVELEKIRVDDVDMADLLISDIEKIKSLKISSVMFDWIIVDEVQDFIPLQLQAIMKLSKSPVSCLFAGDTCQTINPGCAFSFQTIINMYKKSVTVNDYKTIFLSENYRSKSGVICLANRMVQLLQMTFPESVRFVSEEAENMKETHFFEGPNARFFGVLQHEGKPSPKKYVFELFSSFDSWAGAAGDGETKLKIDADRAFIIVRDDTTRDELRKSNLLDALIMTPFESKGLENDEVVVLDFFNTDDEPWNIASSEFLSLLSPGHAALSKSELRGSERLRAFHAMSKNRSLKSEGKDADNTENKEKVGGISYTSKKEKKFLHSAISSIHEVKQLYVALTRAREACTIIQGSNFFTKSKHFRDFCANEIGVRKVDQGCKLLHANQHGTLENFDFILDKVRRLLFKGKSISRKARDDETGSWKLYYEVSVCLNQGYELLNSIPDEQRSLECRKCFNELINETKMSQADYLRCQAQQDQESDQEEIKNKLLSAAKLYLEIGKLKLASKCYFMAKKYLEAGMCILKPEAICCIDYDENFEAFKIFVQGKLFKEAALCLQCKGLIEMLCDADGFYRDALRDSVPLRETVISLFQSILLVLELWKKGNNQLKSAETKQLHLALMDTLRFVNLLEPALHTFCSQQCDKDCAALGKGCTIVVSKLLNSALQSAVKYDSNRPWTLKSLWADLSGEFARCVVLALRGLLADTSRVVSRTALDSVNKTAKSSSTAANDVSFLKYSHQCLAQFLFEALIALSDAVECIRSCMIFSSLHSPGPLVLSQGGSHYFDAHELPVMMMVSRQIYNNLIWLMKLVVIDKKNEETRMAAQSPGIPVIESFALTEKKSMFLFQQLNSAVQSAFEHDFGRQWTLDALWTELSGVATGEMLESMLCRLQKVTRRIFSQTALTYVKETARGSLTSLDVSGFNFESLAQFLHELSVTLLDAVECIRFCMFFSGSRCPGPLELSQGFSSQRQLEAVLKASEQVHHELVWLVELVVIVKKLEKEDERSV